MVMPAGQANWIYLEPVGVPVITVDGASSREWRTVLALDEASFRSSSSGKPESNLLVHLAAIPLDPSSGDVPRILRTIALDTHDESVKVGARWMHGRPARREGPHLYWPYVGRDFVEIRRSPLAPSGG
jgi:hypothetical protein